MDTAKPNQRFYSVFRSNGDVEPPDADGVQTFATVEDARRHALDDVQEHGNICIIYECRPILHFERSVRETEVVERKTPGRKPNGVVPGRRKRGRPRKVAVK